MRLPRGDLSNGWNASTCTVDMHAHSNLSRHRMLICWWMWDFPGTAWFLEDSTHSTKLRAQTEYRLAVFWSNRAVDLGTTVYVSPRGATGLSLMRWCTTRSTCEWRVTRVILANTSFDENKKSISSQLRCPLSFISKCRRSPHFGGQGRLIPGLEIWRSRPWQ